LVGQTVSRYKILDKLGEGGMGIVYKAEDTRLHRTVALKILRPEASESRELKARLSKEAEVAAALDHPNITTVYEIDEADGHTFLAMPLVEGETLSARIKQRPLPLAEALDIATQIAEALHVAHEKGVVHRDIKPGNIMVTPEGRVKVMDFGLAHLAGQTHITKTGTIMGTPAYVSPEQAQGLPADSRSDIWSLATVLYEMVAGRQPFPGQTSQSVMYSIIHNNYEPITALRVGVPPELDRIVGKALSKRPEERYQHANEMIVDLRAMGKGRAKSDRRTVTVGVSRRSLVYGAIALALVILAVVLGQNADRLRSRYFSRSAAKIESIAILPLQNLSGDPEQQYFSDGMTEALYTDLAKISALKVISPRSARKYEGTDTTLRQIADGLGVDAIVQGSAVRTGDQVRITAQLIDAERDENLWADSYARNFRDVLTLQNEVARAIARRVQVELSPDEALRLSSVRQVDADAYEAYLKGNFERAKMTRPGLDAALEHYESVIERDPNFALGYVGVGKVWGIRSQVNWVTPAESVPKMKDAYLKALELDNTLAEVHQALGGLRTFKEWDWEAGEASFRYAIEINPNYPDAHRGYALLLMIVGRWEEAWPQIERAKELDPSNLFLLAHYAQMLLNVGRYDEALPICREVLAIVPDHPAPLSQLVAIYHDKGMQEEAITAQKNEITVDLGEAVAQAFQGVHAESGYEAAFRFAAEAYLKHFVTPAPSFVARLYVFAGEKDLALDQLEKGFELRNPNIAFLGVMGAYAPLRDNPRFQDLLRRMNLPQYQAVPGGS
jgi:serine/threonine protein kinase/tetratricopeptide (TPR) repeat protein